jgi:ankyrin repeat protein
MASARTSLSAEVGNGHTGLMWAALEGNTGAVNALLRRGVNVNERDSEGHTALMFAVINLHLETVKTLLEHGADLNVCANDGATALMLAASSGDAAIVRLLLNNGADRNARYVDTDRTAASLAAEKGYADIADLLNTN